ncbi:MAG: type II toxin-antitoxin system YhaV family toxin [Acetobacteraceae bacterium]|nr:type II toxin-antitoxin system YhaV family toxin [Acetobacteraceae bacterium]
MLQRNGWLLFGHPLFLDRVERLIVAAERARQADPDGWQGNANVRLLAALRDLVLELVPRDPLAVAFRQGNTLGSAHRHWFRAKFGGNRFRLFFRADSAARVAVYAWVSDRDTLRKAYQQTKRGQIMAAIDTFCRQVRSRSNEHQQAMRLMAQAGLAGQMAAILRQELDSMVRVIYLLAQPSERRRLLIESSVNGEKWSQKNSKGPVTDKEMVDLSQDLQGWTRSVYKFGCAFIHLSSLHDHNHRDPLSQLTIDERADIVQHCRDYHGGPTSNEPTFLDIIPYFPRVLEKISRNLECYLQHLENEASPPIGEI